MELNMNNVPENLDIPMITTVDIPEEPQIAPKEYAYGKVVGCKKLNIRVAPNAMATVAKTINKGSDVIIDETESTDDFYKICTESGLEGFCMRQFIAIEP